MSNVETSTRTITEHLFHAPCPEPSGGTPKDLSLALHYAANKAKELGIDTSYDDWCAIRTDEDGLTFVVTETQEDQ